MKTTANANPDRRDTLLRAAYDLLKQAQESAYVLDAMAITVHYDKADCDGQCLMDDIAYELGIPEDEPPRST